MACNKIIKEEVRKVTEHQLEVLSKTDGFVSFYTVNGYTPKSQYITSTLCQWCLFIEVDL